MITYRIDRIVNGERMQFINLQSLEYARERLQRAKAEYPRFRLLLLKVTTEIIEESPVDTTPQS